MAYRLNPGHEDGPRRQPRDPARAMRRRRAARRTVSVLPTLCTLGNLLCGFMSVFLASRPVGTLLPLQWTPLTFAAIFIFLGMVMDAMDGRIARMTHNTSDLGAQLDSMADMVTFGVAPAFMAVQLIGISTPFFGEGAHDLLFDRIALAIASIYVSCAALRLARFNLQLHLPSEADHGSFKGLPSPGAAGTVGSLVLLHQHFLAHRPADDWLLRYSAVAMVAIMLLVAFAMVSRFRYTHMANRLFRGRVGIRRMAIGVSVALLLAVEPQKALAAGFTLYALSAPTVWLWGLVTGQPGDAGSAAKMDGGATDAPQTERKTG